MFRLKQKHWSPVGKVVGSQLIQVVNVLNRNHPGNDLLLSYLIDLIMYSRTGRLTNTLPGYKVSGLSIVVVSSIKIKLGYLYPKDIFCLVRKLINFRDDLTYISAKRESRVIKSLAILSVSRRAGTRENSRLKNSGVWRSDLSRHTRNNICSVSHKRLFFQNKTHFFLILKSCKY